MAEETPPTPQEPGGPGPIRRVHERRDMPNFKDAQDNSDAVAETLKAAKDGKFDRRDDRSASMLPNTQAERPWVEVRLLDGRTVTLAQPPVAVGFIIGRILGQGESANPLSVGYAKTLMYVAAIDGQTVRRPSDMPTLQELANTLGDDALDHLMQAYGEHWPQSVRLEVLKKNLPG